MKTRTLSTHFAYIHRIAEIPKSSWNGLQALASLDRPQAAGAILMRWMVMHWLIDGLLSLTHWMP